MRLRALLVVLWLCAWCAVACASPWRVADPVIADGPVVYGNAPADICAKLTAIQWVGGWDSATAPYTYNATDSRCEAPNTFSGLNWFVIFDCASNDCTDQGEVLSGYWGTYPFGSGGSGTVSFPDVFKLSSSQAAQLGTAIILVWAVAWGWRTAVRMLKDDAEHFEES